MKRTTIPLLTIMGLAGSTATLAVAHPAAELPGQWSGWGAVTLNSGTTEKMKCIAVYKVASGGGQVQQNLKCASTSYNINAVADLTVLNGQVSGRWEEKSYSATGAVSGKASGNVFNLSIDGGAFTAAMNVATTGCKQSINIVPQGMDISKITIGLGKCRRVRAAGLANRSWLGTAGCIVAKLQLVTLNSQRAVAERREMMKREVAVTTAILGWGALIAISSGFALVGCECGSGWCLR